jgi:MFS family permease
VRTTRTLGTPAKLQLLGALYLSQGLPFGFFTQALPMLMRKAGYSLRLIGLSSLLALPWAGKFLWAPLVDRFGSETHGRRRSWILPLQGITALTLAGIAAATRGGPPPILGLLAACMACNLLCATQDIATDGLAVDMLTHEQRGWANGVQVAGYRLGMILGGGVLLVVSQRFGLAAAFAGMALLVLVASGPLLFAREAAAPAVDQPAGAAPHFLLRGEAAPILLLLLLYKAGEAFAAAMLRPFLSDLGLTLEDVGWMLGTVGFTAGLLGALTGGAAVTRLGRKRALVLFGLLQTLPLLGYAAVAARPVGRPLLYGVTALEHFGSGTATATLFTCMMDWCRPTSSATDYTVQASAVVIATGAAGSLSGYSAGHIGYAAHFLIGAAISLVAVGAVVALERPFVRRPG